jgi:multidrug resistance protein, MATE family
MTLPMDVINISFENYLMSIGVVEPSMWCNITFNVSLLLLNSLFVFVLHWDYTCLAYSWVISTYIMAIVQWSLSWNHPSVQRTLQPWSKDALQGWGRFVSLGLSETIMLGSEWFAYEVLNLFASFKDTGAGVGAAVAAQTIILQTAGLVFMIPLGLGVASASLIGNAIGAKKRALAIQLGTISSSTCNQYMQIIETWTSESLNIILSITLFLAGWLAVSVIAVLEVFVAASIFFFGIYFIDFFNADYEVRKLAKGSLPFLSVFCFFDAVQGVLGGILRGSGKQMVGAAVNFIAFYVVGLPLAYHFCFYTSWGIPGLMLGLSGGVIFQVIVLLSLITCCESSIFPVDSTIDSCSMSNSQHSLVSDADSVACTEHDQDKKIELEYICPVRY